jgi:hypothetical protein
LRFRFRLCLVVLAATASGCATEPLPTPEVTGSWMMDLTFQAESGTCTVSGAALTLTGSPESLGGTLEGGDPSCPATWPDRYTVMMGHQDRDQVAFSLTLPGEGEPHFTLEGRVRDGSMNGTLRSVPGSCQCTNPVEVTGSWTAER